jgi:mRNA-degrading endonuclease YafQ of YafQ-DinJ toxin-antitoxin module
MTIKKIFYTSNFVKKWKKLTSAQKKKFKKRIKIFKNNPFDKRLKTHKLKGTLSDKWSFSLDYKHRVLFNFKKNKRALFYDFGTHRIYR